MRLHSLNTSEYFKDLHPFPRIELKLKLQRKVSVFRNHTGEHQFRASKWNTSTWELYALIREYLSLITWLFTWSYHQLWTRKWKAAEDKARATLFGYYGLNLAVHTFPPIALAIIRSFYLNLKPRESIRRKGRKLTAGFSNPLVVNTLLGVLSTLEILAVFLFILFLAWNFYAHISNDFKNLKPAKSLMLNSWQLKYLKVETRFGLLAEVCLAFLLFPILRGLGLFRLLGIQFEASVRYHIWLGTAMIFFATFHGASTLFICGVGHFIQEEIWEWQKTGRIYLAGEICLVTGSVIWITTSLPQIRRKQFEIFYYTHHLYMVFLVFFLFHAGDRHFYMVFPGIFLFGLDKFLLIIQSRPETCILSARIFPSKAIELILPKDPGPKYRPTGIIFVKVPSISKYEWHSFSITSSSRFDDNTISIMIKSEGSWTSSLSHMIQTRQESDGNQTKYIPIAVEGPYGSVSMDFLRCIKS
ncbi:PREDICTED: ferric reduction oxidase 8, mitochondrial-like [Prunus mume]|uniref:Ferric reduction oxidase 8, mitochondrial-like n=1 Tax=Prunus mume TaxID=102107 RepID=A0ABM1LUD6_PRUMU|nr:PREDICTED: ferric reduction oxidase 8, mitochondrial-like [Prunus mume]